MKKLTDALKKSLKDSSQELTADMRNTAVEQGWDEGIAQGMTINLGLGSIAMAVKSSIQEKVMDLEYGTTQSTPNAVMRKYSNNRPLVEGTIIANLEKELGMKL